MVRGPFSQIPVALATILIVMGLAAPASAQDKFDRALRESKKSGESQRVIFKSRAGYEAWAAILSSSRVTEPL